MPPCNKHHTVSGARLAKRDASWPLLLLLTAPIGSYGDPRLLFKTLGEDYLGIL